MQPSQYWKATRNNGWIIAIVVLAGLASTAYYTLTEPARYESSTVLLLNPSLPGGNGAYAPTNELAANSPIITANTCARARSGRRGQEVALCYGTGGMSLVLSPRGWSRTASSSRSPAPCPRRSRRNNWPARSRRSSWPPTPPGNRPAQQAVPLRANGPTAHHEPSIAG